jgi:hypothetical protein
MKLQFLEEIPGTGIQNCRNGSRNAQPRIFFYLPEVIVLIPMYVQLLE